MDDASNGLDESSHQALNSLGANSSNIRFRGSYILICYRNKKVFEEYSQDRDLEFSFPSGSRTESLKWKKSISLVSGGANSGSASSITLAGTELSPKKRGINIVVLSDDFNVLETAHFDTYESSYRVLDPNIP